MRLAVLCLVMLVFSGCLANSSTNTSDQLDDGTQEFDTEPVPDAPEQELTEREKTEPRGEPTREESTTAMTTSPPGSTKTITFQNSMLSVADILVNVPNGIVIEPTSSSNYSIQFVLTTQVVGPAADVLFDQYDIILNDYLDGNGLVLEAISEPKPDSAFGCNEIAGIRSCVGLSPVTVAVLAKIPAAAIDFDLRTNLGSISVEEIAGIGIAANINMGDVKVAGNFGQVNLESNQGNVNFEGEAAKVDLSTNSGSIFAQGKFNQLSMDTNNGDLNGGFIAKKVDASTNNGDGTFQWTPMGSSEFQHDSNSGSLDLTIPEEFQVRLELSSSLGGSQTDGRFSEVEEGVWETSDYAVSAVRSEVKSAVNSGNQSVQ